MSEQTRILVVEDDPTMQKLLASHLSARGYGVTVAGDGWDALRAAEATPPHVVLVDIALPHGMSGLELCQRMRASSAVPIILVTASQRPETKVMALDMGGDDYLCKPFHAEELLARIRAVLRRARPESSSQGLKAGALTVDVARRLARCGEEPVHLTKTEFDLLVALLRNSDRTLTHRQLLEAVWGPAYDDVRAVHAHMSHLRRKLEAVRASRSKVVAVPGVGYRLDVAD